MSHVSRKRLTPGPKLLGYARVSTAQQDLTRQRRALKAARCDDVFEDVASGKSMKGRPELDRLLTMLAPGDCLVIAEWDRATRSMFDGMTILQKVIEAGAAIKVLDFSSLDLTTPEGRGFIAMFSAMAERERIRINKRTSEGQSLGSEGWQAHGPQAQADAVSAKRSTHKSCRRLVAARRGEAFQRVTHGDSEAHMI